MNSGSRVQTAKMNDPDALTVHNQRDKVTIFLLMAPPVPAGGSHFDGSSSMFSTTAFTASG